MIFKEELKNIIFFFLNILASIIQPFVKSLRVSILMYHSVGDNKVLFTVSKEDFERQMEYLKRNNYNVISLADLVDQLKNKENVKDKTVVLTFDDGFKDNHENAWPILKRYNFPATIFLPTKYVGSSISNSENASIEVLSEKEIKEMSGSGLIEFGSHTHSHPRFDKINDEEFEKELRLSKNIIEKIIGKACRLFSYPKGRFRESFLGILKNTGFDAAVTVKEGLVKPNDNLFLLKRNFVYSKGGFQQFKGKLDLAVEIFHTCFK